MQQNIQKKMKKVVLLLASVFIFAACQESLEERATRVLKEYSEKNCPMQLDPSIIMDSCAFEVDSHTLHYYYSLLGAMDNDSTLPTVQMREALLGALKNETSTRTYKEAGYNFKYTYHSQKQPGKVLFEALMTKKDYAN